MTDDPPIKQPLELARWLHERYAQTKEIELYDAAVAIESMDRSLWQVATERAADMDRMEQAAETIERLTRDRDCAKEPR